MKYTDMLKINPKSEVSSSTSTNYNNIIHPDTTFFAKDILVQYEDVAEELSDKAKPEKKGQHRQGVVHQLVGLVAPDVDDHADSAGIVFRCRIV